MYQLDWKKDYNQILGQHMTFNNAFSVVSSNMNKKFCLILMIFYFILDVSVSDMNDEDGAGGSSKSNSITSEHSLQSTGISASSQVILNTFKPKK